MSTRRTKGDSSATATRKSTRLRDEALREEDSDSATTLGSETGMADETPASENESEPAQPTNAFTFGSFKTPDLESVSKELEGTKEEPLAIVAASHPMDMKGEILEHGAKMIDLFLTLRQKIDARSKQMGTTDDGAPYIPGSLRNGNPIAVPKHLKGNAECEEILERGNVENEARKQAFAGIACDMTQAVIHQTTIMLQKEFWDALTLFADLLIVNYEEYANFNVEYEHSNCSEVLASYAAFIFIHDELDGESDIRKYLGLNEDVNDSIARYRQHQGCPGLTTMLESICAKSDEIAKRVAADLGDIMGLIVVGGFRFHLDKERARKTAARSKAIKEKHKQKKKNEEMQRRIAKEEQEDREAAERGELPKRMIDQIKAETIAQVRKELGTQHKKERVKDLGGRKNQRQRPTKNGTKQRSNSKQPRGKSKRDSTKSPPKSRKNSRGKSQHKTGAQGKTKSRTKKSNGGPRPSSNEDSKSSSRRVRNAGRGRGGQGGRRNAPGRGKGKKN